MLEQAAHFIKPIVEKIISTYDEKPEIKLIQSNKKGNYAKELMSVLSQKDHDIFASIVKDEKEFPLFFLEVSFAVPTRDHILQRFDAYLQHQLLDIHTLKSHLLKKFQPVNMEEKLILIL